jgi:hypothetical protein
MTNPNKQQATKEETEAFMGYLGFVVNLAIDMTPSLQDPALSEAAFDSWYDFMDDFVESRRGDATEARISSEELWQRTLTYINGLAVQAPRQGGSREDAN